MKLDAMTEHVLKQTLTNAHALEKVLQDIRPSTLDVRGQRVRDELIQALKKLADAETSYNGMVADDAKK